MTPLIYFLQRYLLVIGILSCSLLNYAQSPGYVWGRAISSSSYLNLGYSVVDAPGNVYMAGAFADVVDFDPGPATSNLTSVGDADAFICKLNTSGNLVWAIQLGGTGADTAEYVTVDALGNVYVTGSFSGTVDFDPGPGLAALTAQAGTDAFVAKYDAAGNYVWATSFAESDNSTGKAVGVDGTGNVYVTGNFSGLILFTNGLSYTSLGGNDVFICKLNAAGGLIWGDRIGGSSIDNASGIVADATGNVYACGNFQNGTIDLDPGPDSTNYLAGTPIVYLVKLNDTGGLVWAIRSFVQTANDLKMAATGNLYLIGGLAGIVDLDPGPGTMNVGQPFTSNSYFWELTGDGAYVLGKAYLGVGTAGNARSVNVDVIGNIYTAGGTGDFNKWDKNGTPLWLYSYGFNNTCIAIGTDGLQNAYTAGNFHFMIDLDPGIDTAIIRTNVTYGIFANKLAQSAGGSLPLTWLNLEGHLNSQQQSTLSFTVNENNVARYTVEKSMEGTTFSTVASLQSKGNGTHNYVYTEPTALQQTAWYRIQQTDIDEHSGYSAVIRLVAGKVRVSATVFPVPASGQVTLQITGEELLHTKAVLVDIKGIQVRSMLINDYNMPVDLHNLPAGLYILQLANGSSLKIMKQE
jgi:hypothetical protein